MRFRELKVGGAWVVTPVIHGDSRGAFLELYKSTAFTEAVGHPFDLRQVNTSVSAPGVLRGVHFADVPPGQAKYVTCLRGAILDVIVDIRVGSPTFGTWDAVLLDDVNRAAVYLGEGLGHAFCALDDHTTVQYLCSSEYSPTREHGIHPLDTELAIDWPSTDRQGRPMEHELSAKDLAAPTFAEALASGLLPTWDATAAYVGGLDAAARA